MLHYPLFPGDPVLSMGFLSVFCVKFFFDANRA